MKNKRHHPGQYQKDVATIASIAACLFASAMLGCERRGIEERTVDKGVERAPDASTNSSATSPQPATPVDSEAWPWTVPAGWTEDPEPRPMRLTTYLAPAPGGPVEVAVTRFGGRVGGELANINRWRGQMGMPPIGEADLEGAIVRFSSSGYDGYQTRLDSPDGVMLAAGIYEESIDQTWFVRATVANAEAADQIEADLFTMARSIAAVNNKDEG